MNMEPRILITGETAGTGTSTLGKLLAKTLNLPTVSGGKFLRALAFDFKQFNDVNKTLPPEEQYKQFKQKYQSAYIMGIESASALFQDYLENEAQSAVLAELQAAIEEGQKDSGILDPIWDYLVDKNTIKHAFSQAGFVWEAKLAIIVLQIDQLQSVIPQNQLNENPPFKVLLTVDPQIAAQRVSERENRPVDIDEVLTRKRRDFERYGSIYTINDKKIEHTDLQKHADLIIDSGKINPNQVAVKILQSYKQIIQSQTQAQELNQKLESALQKLSS